MFCLRPSFAALGSGNADFGGVQAPPNYPLFYPKYPLLRTIRALLRGTWVVPCTVSSLKSLRLRSLKVRGLGLAVVAAQTLD